MDGIEIGRTSLKVIRFGHVMIGQVFERLVSQRVEMACIREGLIMELGDGRMGVVPYLPL